MTLTILRRDDPSRPLVTLPEVVSVYSDGDSVWFTQVNVPPGDAIDWAMPLEDVAELQLSEP